MTIESHLLFAKSRLREEWNSGNLPEIVRTVVDYIVNARWERLHQPTLVTSIWRSAEEEKRLGGKGPHSDWRAVDLGVDKRFLTIEQQTRDEVNRLFPTDVVGMPRVPRLDHGTGLHYHVQATRTEAKRTGGSEMKKGILAILLAVLALCSGACDRDNSTSPTEPNNPWVVDYVVRASGDETVVIRGVRIAITSHSLDVPYLESNIYGMTEQVTIYQRVEPETTSVAVSTNGIIGGNYKSWSGTISHTRTWDARSQRYVWRGIIRLDSV